MQYPRLAQYCLFTNYFFMNSFKELEREFCFQLQIPKQKSKNFLRNQKTETIAVDCTIRLKLYILKKHVLQYQFQPNVCVRTLQKYSYVEKPDKIPRRFRHASPT